MHIDLLSLGTLPYEEAVDLQQRVVADRKASMTGDTLLSLEHRPILTLGLNSERMNPMSAGPAQR